MDDIYEGCLIRTSEGSGCGLIEKLARRLL